MLLSSNEGKDRPWASAYSRFLTCAVLRLILVRSEWRCGPIFGIQVGGLPL